MALAPSAASAALVYSAPFPPPPEGSSVFVANDDGSAPRRMARGNTPQVSPDGRLVAYFVSTVEYDKLYVKPVSSAEKRLLIRDAVATGSPTAVAWRPDSRSLIAGVQQRGAVVIDLADRSRRRVPLERFGGASWKPSAERFAVADSHVRGSDLFAVRTESLAVRDTGAGYSPVWGAPGLAFARFHAVLLRPRIGKPARVLLKGDFPTLRPVAWGPSGKRLLVMKGPVKGRSYRAVLINPKTRARTQVPYPFADVAGISKDGREILGTNLKNDVVAVRRNGTARILAQHAVRPSWTK
jgi:hypothetical protein